MSDLISRQAAIDVPEKFINDCNPEHFVGHQKFIEYMDDAEIGSFGNWQFANGFNMGLTAAEVAIKKLPSAQPEQICKYWDSESNFCALCRPSAQPENQVHLCDSCRHVYPECPSGKDDVIFGDGKGNDNICACNKYEPSAQPREGKWIRTRTLMHDGELYCDQCEQEHPEQKLIWNFCPNCGCRMEEGDSE